MITYTCKFKIGDIVRYVDDYQFRNDLRYRVEVFEVSDWHEAKNGWYKLTSIDLENHTSKKLLLSKENEHLMELADD